MNKKSVYLFGIFVFIVSFLVVEVAFLQLTKTINEDAHKKKIAFVKLTNLPDICISTEATFVRHRSLADVFSIYKDDASLREYFPSTFAISPSANVIKKN